jgi:hypothetical protein
MYDCSDTRNNIAMVIARALTREGHNYVSLDKAYEYAHAGLYVICTSSFETVTRTLNDNCSSFEDYNDLVLLQVKDI